MEELGKVDVIVAADVVEHFADTRRVVEKLKKFMNTHMVLATSLPTENTLYELLRLLFRKKKPEDHYYYYFVKVKASEVIQKSRPAQNRHKHKALFGQ